LEAAFIACVGQEDIYRLLSSGWESRGTNHTRRKIRICSVANLDEIKLWDFLIFLAVVKVI
jgi:hypothetical protein